MTVWGSLRTLGRIETAGLLSENALDVVVVLEGCEWDAVASSDGGRTWRLIEKAQLPKALTRLPAQGEVLYQIADSSLLLRSDDSGSTWTNASPWRFLDRARRDDVEAEKNRFLERYGHWLPPGETWPIPFTAAVVVLLAVGGWHCRKLCGRWFAPVAFSFAAYCLFGLALFAVHEWFIHWLCTEQWNYRLGHWDGGVMFPQWPLGVLLHLTGNAWLAPMTATALFPATPLWDRIVSGQRNSSGGRLRTLAPGLPVVCLLILLGVSWIQGIGRGWCYGVEARASSPQDGAANGNQPISSGTNPIPSTAGPGR
jgi:hypothetical protein